MATKARNDLPAAPPAFVFKGAVKKIRSATMKQVPVSDRTAIVRVEQVLETLKSFAHYEGKNITVELAARKAVKAGDKFISHANSACGCDFEIGPANPRFRRGGPSCRPERKCPRCRSYPPDCCRWCV